MKVRALVAAVLTAALAAGCGSSFGGSGSGGTIKVATLRQPHLYHPAFYERFVPSGTEIEIVPLENSTEIKNAVVTGSADFGVTGITSAIQGAAAGEPFRVLASAADGGSAIVAAEEAGIDGTSDLRGRKIGYVPASAQDILLRLTLRAAGLDPERDVELVKVDFADMANALARGDIDAFSGAETGPSDSLEGGESEIVTYPYDTPMGKINIVLGTSQQMIDQDPKMVRQVVAAHVKATKYMATHKPEWGEAVSTEYGFSPESVERAIGNISLRWQVDRDYVAQAEVLGDEQQKLAQINSEPDYDEFFDTRFLPKPERTD